MQFSLDLPREMMTPASGFRFDFDQNWMASRADKPSRLTLR